MRFPDWENPIIIFNSSFTGSSKSGIVPKDGILCTYIGANSQFFIGRNGFFTEVARHAVGSIEYNHFIMNTTPVKKGDTWFFKNSDGALHVVKLIPYK